MKNFKIICFNLLFFAVFFVILEFICRQEFLYDYREDVQHCKEWGIPIKLYYPVKKFDYKTIVSPVLKKVYKGSKKGSIITIGCSYTEGFLLDDETQTFAYKLNQYTNRTTYNRGIKGTGPQVIYRQLIDENFTKEIPEAEYIIYTFIYQHMDRLFPRIRGFFTNDVNINYDVENGKLVEMPNRFESLYFLYTVKKIISCVADFKQKEDVKNERRLFFITMQEILKASKKIYPNSKFIFIEFPDSYMCKDDYFPGSRELTQKQIKRLEQMGVIYINAEQLVGHDFRNIKKYRLKDDDHPNEQVWNEIVPALVKKLDL